MSFLNIPLTFYVLKASVRDKLVLSLMLFFIAAVSMSLFIGSSAVTEPDAAILTFIASSARFIAVISLILFVVFYVRRAYETHDIEYLLSRPINRISFITSHLFALSILSICFSFFIAAGIFLYASSFINGDGFMLWFISLTLEFMIVSYAAFFFSMVLPSAVTGTMATLAGYILARMSGQILNIIDAGNNGEIFGVLGKIMEASSVIVPRFDLFSQSAWLLYGPDANISLIFILLHGILFSLLIGCAAIFDLLRKEF